MHVAVMFSNIGSYHAARLRAVDHACRERGWRLTAVQVTDSTLQHPWGDLRREISFPVLTLLPLGGAPPEVAEQAVTRIRREHVERAFDGLRPDAVAVPGWGLAASRAVFGWCSRRGVIRVLMSETRREDGRRRWWKESLKAVYVRRFHAALVAGTSHRDYLVSLGFPSQRIFLGYDVVDNTYFSNGALQARTDPAASRIRQPRLPDRPFLLSMTRFLPRKGVPDLVRGYAAYRQRVGSGAAWDLVICGAGSQEAMIWDTVCEYGIQESVHLPGFLPYDALGDWYGLAEALVHVPWYEPWGLVLNEACAAALPIICTRSVGAYQELVRHGESGFLVEPGDIDGLADALVRMHSMTHDERTAFGHLGYELVSKFGPERFATGLLDAIDLARSSEPHRR